MAKLPQKSKQLSYGGYESLVSVRLNDYKGYEVYTSAEYSELTGKMVSGSKLYDVCDDEDIIDSFKTLKEAHRFIDSIF